MTRLTIPIADDDLPDEPVRMPYVEEGRTSGRQIPERPYVKPAPTTMPGPGESREAGRRGRVGLPVARLHGAGSSREWLIALAILAVAIGGMLTRSDLSDRIDLANAEAARAYAHTAILEARLVQFTHRDVKPANDPRVDVCIVRTDALRRALFALVRTGTVSMPNDPGWNFIAWDDHGQRAGTPSKGQPGAKPAAAGGSAAHLSTTEAR